MLINKLHIQWYITKSLVADFRHAIFCESFFSWGDIIIPHLPHSSSRLYINTIFFIFFNFQRVLPSFTFTAIVEHLAPLYSPFTLCMLTKYGLDARAAGCDKSTKSSIPRWVGSAEGFKGSTKKSLWLGKHAAEGDFVHSRSIPARCVKLKFYYKKRATQQQATHVFKILTITSRFISCL
jgi:hypothetical protein